jgi:hypothetical protein
MEHHSFKQGPQPPDAASAALTRVPLFLSLPTAWSPHLPALHVLLSPQTGHQSTQYKFVDRLLWSYTPLLIEGQKKPFVGSLGAKARIASRASYRITE